MKKNLLIIGVILYTFTSCNEAPDAMELNTQLNDNIAKCDKLRQKSEEHMERSKEYLDLGMLKESKEESNKAEEYLEQYSNCDISVETPEL